MPLYDFFCPQCQTHYEELIMGDHTPACPACGHAESERRISAPSPQKSGAFPYKVGPVHPVAKKMSGAPACAMAGGCGVI